jgi:hypothetical protein
LNKDFYHTSSTALEVKSLTPNGVAFKITGKSTHEHNTSGLVRFDKADCKLGVADNEVQIEAKYTDKPSGSCSKDLSFVTSSRRKSNFLYYFVHMKPENVQLLIPYH